MQGDGSKVPPECVIYDYVVNNQCWELNLVQKLMTIILGVEHSSHKVSITAAIGLQIESNHILPFRNTTMAILYYDPTRKN